MRKIRKGGDWRWFAMLCLIASGRWIFEDAAPQFGSTLRSEAWACGVATLLAFVLVVGFRRPVPSLRSALRLLAVGGGLLAAPAFGAALHRPASDSFDRTVALCLVPVIVTVLSGIWSDTGVAASSLWPGLAGIGGAMLVFPLTLPTNIYGYAGLLAPPIVVGAACVACRRVVQGVAAEWSAALLLAGGTICLVLTEAGRMATSTIPVRDFSVWAVVIDVVLVGLTVVVVLRMDAIRYASRYFLIPMLTIVEGLLVLRGGTTLRLSSGIALLAAAAVALLRERGEGGASNGLGLTS